MSGVLIIQPLPHGSGPFAGGTGVENLLTRDPKEIWVAPSAEAQGIDIDMGAAVTVDSFFLGFTNAGIGATWNIYTATGLTTGLVVVHTGAMRPADSIGPRHHCFVRLAAPVTSRYFKIVAAQAGAAPLQSGALVLGLAFEQWREFGGGRVPVDTGERQDLTSGGFGIGDGVVKAQFNWSFIDLSDAEVARLWAISRARGLRKPIVVVEDADLPAAQNEAIHYGVFDRFQPYERSAPETTRWAFSVLGWE